MDTKVLKIATCRCRTDKKLTNQGISWEEFCDKASHPCRTPETLEQYRQMSKNQQSDLKDVGGFVGGHLKDGRRKKGCVLCRSVLSLDLDHAEPDTWKKIKSESDFRCCVYSTRNYTADKPRLRLIVPLTREVSGVEYEAVGRQLADKIGMDLFDPTTFQPERLMYWPSTSVDGEFFFDRMDGPDLDPDEYLALYTDWTDESTWPQHPLQNKTAPVKHKPSQPNGTACDTPCEQADPLEKPGIIGAFCRAYFPVQMAIEKFLRDVYAPSATPGRYDYLLADSTAGVEIYEDRYIYSHHATDPLQGKLLNAFDLVRLHHFGHMDTGCHSDTPMEESPSFKAMAQFALNDDKARALFDEERYEQAIANFDVIDDVDIGETNDSEGNVDRNADGAGNSSDGGGPDDTSNGSTNNGADAWKKKLEYDKSGRVKPTLKNLLYILKNDPELQALVYNELQDNLEIRGKLPWPHPLKYWRDADEAQLMSYICVKYGQFPLRLCNIALTKIADDRSYHPIKEYLKSLPAWDGVKRVDTLLIDYLGAEDIEYVRTVTRKTLCAAISRVLHPGCKFDHMLVLVGPQGMGKSTLIAMLGGDWFSDSLSFGDTRDKTAAEKLQGYWILEIGELAGLKNAEVEVIRGFITRQNDIYRAAYAKRPTSHARQCIFIGTSNSTTGFLRDTAGNRRFWPVQTPGNGVRHPQNLAEAEIQQIWAETLMYVNRGETLYLDAALEDVAKEAQRNAMEYDEREGLVQEYLETPISDNWDVLPHSDRMKCLCNRSGTIQRTEVCSMEIWCECFDKRQEDLKPADSRDITAILTRLGWNKSSKKKRVPPYGPQYIFTPKP